MQVKVIAWWVGQLWRERFTVCMVGAIVAGCDTRQQNTKPTKPHFFFIGFVWDTSLKFAFQRSQGVVHDIHGIVQSSLSVVCMELLAKRLSNLRILFLTLH
jgi:hypothetical protein